MTSTRWAPVLERLAQWGLTSLFCINKAHEVQQSSCFFQPESEAAVTVIPKLISLILRPCTRILLSATLHHSDVDVHTELLGDMRLDNLRSKLDFSTIKFTTHISSASAVSVKKITARDFVVLLYQ